MTTDRRLEILRAIVDEYVETQEPVGSKAIADKRALGISPATIRNEMAILEDEGLITQPHTSAGRIPTDRGYRLFVDKLSAIKPLSTPERRAIETFLAESLDIDDVVKRSAKLLADITKQVAVVQYPRLGDSSSREMMAISGTANLARSGEDLGSTLSPILEALEEQVVLLRLLSDAHPTVHVTIGSEQSGFKPAHNFTCHSGLWCRSIYGLTRRTWSNTYGLCRFDSAVSAVARYVGRFIAESPK
jgi:heat-inducible transcriptional repressor